MFSSAHHALKWAYEEESKPLVKSSGINNMRGGSRSTTNDVLIGLTPEDRHKQANTIVGFADKLLNRGASQYLGAKYGGEWERAKVEVLLHQICSMLGTGAHNRRAIHMVLRIYLGAKITQEAVRKLLACSSMSAMALRIAVFNVLDVVDCRAMAEMTECLADHGLIEKVAVYA